MTLPVRSKAIDTFADLLDLPIDATVAISRWSSHYEMLQKATDPVLQVTTNLQYSTKFVQET